MYRLFGFLKKVYVAFLFILLEGLVISYYVNSTSYTRAKIYATSNMISGGMNSFFAGIGDYFTLRRDNELLLDRLTAVESELSLYKQAEAVTTVDHVENKYFYSTAKVISNSITRQNNYFVINRGLKDGVEPNMAILSISGAVAGYVQDCSDGYAVCMSILNRDFRIGGRIDGKEYFGSVYWDGLDPQYVTLSDIPRYVPLSEGDPIVSSYSTRFPPESFIGTIESFEEAGDGTYFEIKVKLGIDLMSLSDVMVVHFADSEELNGLAGDLFP